MDPQSLIPAAYNLIFIVLGTILVGGGIVAAFTLFAGMFRRVTG